MTTSLRMTTSVLVLALTACVSTKKETKEVSLGNGDAAPISMQEVAGDSVGDKEQASSKSKKKKKTTRKKSKSEKAVATAPKKPGALSEKAKKQCQELVERIVTPYKALYAKLDKSTYVAENSPLDQLVRLNPQACEDTESYNEATTLMNTATASHSGKIGVIMPLTGKNNQLTTYIVKGMRAGFGEAQQNFEQASVIKDSTAKNPEQLLAELVFKDKVAAVIGGFEAADAQALAKWSEQLMLPVVITHHDRNVGSLSRYAYMLYPDEMRLAYTLAAEAERRGIRRVAILKPASHKSDRLVEYFKQAFTAKGGQIAHDLVYAAGNFDSMQAVSRTIFRIDAGERQDEYRAAYHRARRNARAQGVPFDPRMVVLKPIVNFDAILLPDDFRTARHFAKLFKFHQVDKMTMIGNHEWRSPALVEPYDEFLEGSFFADFIGSYAKLPAAISAPTTGSPFFVQPQSVLAVDFQLIGYRAGRIGSIIAGYKSENRRHLPAKISAITSNSSSFFGDGMVFEKDHQSNWPTYVFGVAGGGLQLENEHTKLDLPAQTPEKKQSAGSVNLSSSGKS